MVSSANCKSLTDWCPDGPLVVYRENNRIHLHVELGPFSWESLSQSRAGTIVLKTEMKSTKSILVQDLWDSKCWRMKFVGFVSFEGV